MLTQGCSSTTAKPCLCRALRRDPSHRQPLTSTPVKPGNQSEWEAAGRAQIKQQIALSAWFCSPERKREVHSEATSKNTAPFLHPLLADAAPRSWKGEMLIDILTCSKKKKRKYCYFRWAPAGTCFLYRFLYCLCKLLVSNVLGPHVVAPRAVRQPRALGELALGQEGGLRACGANHKHVLLEINGALQKSIDTSGACREPGSSQRKRETQGQAIHLQWERLTAIWDTSFSWKALSIFDQSKKLQAAARHPRAVYDGCSVCASRLEDNPPSTLPRKIL